MAAKTRGETKIKRHSLPEIHTYDVTEDELESLSSTDGNIELTFASTVISSALTMFVALLTCDLNGTPKIVSIVLCILFTVAGIYLFACWYSKYKKHNDVVEKIKSR